MNKKRNHLESNLPIVICECGTKILVIPDLGEMELSIMEHAALHEENEADPKKAKAESCRIEEQLTQKVLILITKKSL